MVMNKIKTAGTLTVQSLTLILVSILCTFWMQGTAVHAMHSADPSIVPLYSSTQKSSLSTPVKQLPRAKPIKGEDKPGQLRRHLQKALANLDRIQATSNRPVKQSSKQISSAFVGRDDKTDGPFFQATRDELDVRYRSLAGTPRQIKVQGAISGERTTRAKLQLALDNVAGGPQRDKQTALSFLRNRKKLLRLSDPDQEMKLIRYWRDDLGRRHLRYAQMYEGILVWPAQLNVHLDPDGNVDLMNGAYSATPRRLILEPVFENDEARAVAREAVPSGFDAKKIDSQLIIYAPGSKVMRLAWKVEILVSPKADWLVVVDALNGNILERYNQIKTNLVEGSGIDLLNKTRRLQLWSEKHEFHLIDTSKAMYESGSVPLEPDKTKGAIYVFDKKNNELETDGNIEAAIVSSELADSKWLKDGVSLAYNLSQSYDYFKQVHNRSSIDGQGGNILGFIRVGDNFQNAFWTSEYNAMFFGDGKPYAAALDIVAHELTHGITSFSSNLVYRDQPGALNEALSDVFGEMVEARTTGSTDWINGSVFDEIDGRSLKDPSSVEIISGQGYYYPSRMSEYYHRGSPLLEMLQDEDYGGVHINMTIISHAFYLLAAGLEDAIGRTKAARIFYRAQTIHVLSNSQFIDMRLACIQSAEELYGENSQVIQSVGQAFDAVEIFDDQSKPVPEPIPPISSEDSYIFVARDSAYQDNYLARREAALDDGEYGSWLSTYPVNRARPSVSGDGEIAFYADAYEDACFISTSGEGGESCLEMYGEIYSVSMSPDKEIYGFVLRDYLGEPTNDIMIIDLRPGGESRIFELVAPGTEGYAVDTVVHADAMDFTSDNRYLVYDAYNILRLNDGTAMGVWSIYAIDLETEQTIALIPPSPKYDIGYPSLSQTTNHLLTWDRYHSASGVSTIYAGSLITGNGSVVAKVNGSYGVPCYNGDDTSIVFNRIDSGTPTGFSMYRQAIARDGYTPIGSAFPDLYDAEFGVIYRRGSFSAPEPDIAVSSQHLDFGEIYLNETRKLSLDIENIGGSDLRIDGIAISGPNPEAFSLTGGCNGQNLSAGASCTMTVVFSPATLGTRLATLHIESNDPDTPALDIYLSGLCVQDIRDTDNDGIPDSDEDTNGNGRVDPGETDPNLSDTDGDGLQDGTELGLTLDDIGSGTEETLFQPDLDPETTTNPLNPDTDSDGFSDSQEDDNLNGRLDPGETDPSPSTSSLFFPHVASNTTWETEIAVINDDNIPVQGRLRAYTDSGDKILPVLNISLSAHGRKQLLIGESFDHPKEIGSIVFSSDSDQVRGYMTFGHREKYRTSVPAVLKANRSRISIPHIASNKNWWTGIALFNTSYVNRAVTITFSNKESKVILLPAGGHRSFTVRSLFDGRPQTRIRSGFITKASGVVGLELIGNKDTLSGVLLTDKTATTLYYPHVAANNRWWTGIVGYNPSSSPISLKVSCYDQKGDFLSRQDIQIEGYEKYIGTASSLGLSEKTAWFKIQSPTPMIGFELFGMDNLLAGYSAVDLEKFQGLFPRKKNNGWTGISLINTGANRAEIALSAYTDQGREIAAEQLSVASYAKILDKPENIFSEDISRATYIRYSSTEPVIGFQLNGSADGSMLDALPGL